MKGESMTKLEEKVSRLNDLMFDTVKEVNTLYYDSVIDVDWKKAIGDYHRAESILTQFGIVLEDVIAMFKKLNKGGK